MGKGSRERSLTFKLMAAVCIAVVVAILTFWGTRIICTEFVNQVLLSDSAVNERVGREISSFRIMVSEQELASTDVNAVGQWNRDHRNVQLTISGLTTTIKSDYNGAQLFGNEYGLVIGSEDISATAEFPVNFRDGVFLVSVYDTSAGMYQTAVNIASILTAALVFLAVILFYDQHITRTVQTLSRQVRQVSRGDLQMQIKPMTHDEIGQLALDVDTMRLNIIDKLRREEEAWRANSQLITAISHDVRTPLTALLGYLEILSDDSLGPEERSAYLEICKNNANRLKSLTDELFGFFLVFGRPNPEQKLEEFDAVTLMEQILVEHEMSLNQQGFDLRSVRSGELSGTLRVDLGHMRRIFDNLFSNVGKYADRERPVSIEQAVEHGELHVTITNYIPARTNRVESNRIGLQTCEKLASAMGGEFNQSRTRDSFTVEVTLPLFEAPEN